MTRDALGAEPRQLAFEPRHRHAIGLVLVAGIAVVLGATVWGIPRETAKLPAVAREAMTEALPDWHTLEPVNEVVYGTRGFDTFGETFLLLAAVVGIGLVARSKEPRRGFIGEERAGHEEQEKSDPAGAEGGEEDEARTAESEELDYRAEPETPDTQPLGLPAPERARGMSVVVRGSVRVIAPILAIAGFYLVSWGYSPGGGFPGGAVVLGVILMAYVSVGYKRIARIIRPGLIEPIEMAGALLIIAIEALGLVFKGSFSANFLPLSQPGTIPSGGIMQVFSGGEFIEVATGLTLAVFGLLGMSRDWVPDDDDDGESKGDAAHPAEDSTAHHSRLSARSQ
ncbi:MAG TPA: MnhB domain-containing protein [Acidimicrobiales bacterium]|jgi:multicomponent Na+:H+ antiporter subunit B|nr:MnhB domain-containing protein [Acidimicrobiales bacterium]